MEQENQIIVTIGRIHYWSKKLPLEWTTAKVNT